LAHDDEGIRFRGAMKKGLARPAWLHGSTEYSLSPVNESSSSGQKNAASTAAFS
jgi:hypothetical protein